MPGNPDDEVAEQPPEKTANVFSRENEKNQSDFFYEVVHKKITASLTLPAPTVSARKTTSQVERHRSVEWR